MRNRLEPAEHALNIRLTLSAVASGSESCTKVPAKANAAGRRPYRREPTECQERSCALGLRLANLDLAYVRTTLLCQNDTRYRDPVVGYSGGSCCSDVSPVYSGSPSANSQNSGQRESDVSGVSLSRLNYAHWCAHRSRRRRDRRVGS